MKTRIIPFVALIAVIITAACGSKSNPPVSVGGGSFLYVNTAAGTISGFAITSTGTLTPVSGSPFTDAASTPQGMTATSGTLYVTHPAASNIGAYTFDAKTGVLTRVPGSPFSSPPSRVSNTPQSLAVCGGALYGLSESAYATVYKLNTDGSLGGSTGSADLTTGRSASMAVIPSCKYLYFADPDINAVSAFTITGTTLGFGFTALFSSPVPVGTAPIAVAMDSAGRFLYVANSGSNNLSAFSIDANSGALTPVSGSPFAAGAQPSAITVTSSYVFVTNAGDNTISAYTFNSGTGTLTPVSGSPFATGTHPAAIAVGNTNLNTSPSGILVFTANQGSNNISAFSVGAVGGLTPVSGSPFSAGGTPQGMAVAVGPQ